ncbi:ABC transporter ATP-binding protein (plasmid) [Rhizobium sp. RCAM05350]|uniref:ABC transporter ATP-binding protein n=1 Tax=Rhizobium sp. RCAM05350 TaxID=2895568 RepID=UPI0020768149|nr:ABC transporter ATP-binding protein [Rhizobium sp. RCAM05350]URK89449.1 ABC transporter ATP-binding protein [Rhizobium sp. RCAM05350]
MLTVKNLQFSYGAVETIHGVNLEVKAGEVVALIGANGAGKTTTLRCISGILKPSKASIQLEGKELFGQAAHTVAKAGIAHVLEGRHLFKHLSVRENLMMGAYHRKDKEGILRDLDRVYGLFPRVKERLAQAAGTLSGGEQQMVAMARSIMSDPRILLLDEPSMGLAPKVVDTIFEIIADVAKTGLPILLVEQNANRALSLAHRAYVLEVGSVVLSDTGKALMNNDQVRKSYLGG